MLASRDCQRFCTFALIEMYAVRKDYPFYTTLKLFDMLWLYPKNLEGANLKLFYVGNVIVKLFILILIDLGPILHLIFITNSHKEFNMSEDLSVIVGGAGFSLMYYLMSAFHRRWEPFFINIIDFRKFGKPHAFEYITNKCRILCRLHLLYIFFGEILYATVTIIDSEDCQELQKRTDDNLFCVTLIPVWLPVNVSQRIIFMMQVLIVYVFLMPAGQICFMFYESVMLIVTHIHHFEDHLRLVFLEPHLQRRIVSLRNCVNYHAHIIRMADQLNRLLKTFAGHMSAVWAICFGCIGNQIFKSKPLGAILYLGGYVIALSFFVESGQSLLSESEAIVGEIYNIDWYLGTVQEQKDIMFMLAKAQKPLALSAKPFGNYEYSLFVLIVKTAYSYLTLLKQST